MSRLSPTVPIVASAACHEDPDPPDTPLPAAQLRDSAGVLITENPLPPEGSSLGWEIGPEPTVKIGAAEGEAPYLLYGVMKAATLSDGRIVIADGASDEVRVFDPDGVHLVSWGGEGEGMAIRGDVVFSRSVVGDLEVEYVEVWPLIRGQR